MVNFHYQKQGESNGLNGEKTCAVLCLGVYRGVWWWIERCVHSFQVTLLKVSNQKYTPVVDQQTAFQGHFREKDKFQKQYIPSFDSRNKRENERAG